MLRQAVFLTGGEDARRESPSGRNNLLALVMAEVARQGVDDMILVGEDRAGWEAAVAGGGGRARFLEAPAVEGSLRALRRAADSLDPRFFLFDAHSFFDINLVGFAREAERFAALVALRRTSGEDASSDRQAWTVGKEELARLSGESGVRVIAKSILDDAEAVSLETDVFPRLAADGRLGAVTLASQFWDLREPAAAASLSDHLRRPALFLDRDGVINVDTVFPHRPDQIQWVDGAIEAIRLANDRGYLVIVVTNQSGVARGYYDEESIVALHRWMRDRFAEAGAHVDQFHYCPHHPEAVVAEYRRDCDCRKPAPGMLQAARVGDIRREASLLVGDRATDMEAARNAGIAGHLFAGGNLRDFIDPLLCDWNTAPG